VRQRIERSVAIYGGGVSAGRLGGDENSNYPESFSLSGVCLDGMRKAGPGELLRRFRIPGHLLADIGLRGHSLHRGRCNVVVVPQDEFDRQPLGLGLLLWYSNFVFDLSFSRSFA
jgi:hypothetical protein